MCVNVERHRKLFAHLYVEITQTILAKHTEHTTLGVLLVCLNDKFLRFPCIARSLGHTSARFQRGNYFSGYFHIKCLVGLIV